MNAIISALFTVTLAMLSCHANANTDLLRFEISATIKRISDDGYVVVQIGNIEEWVKPYGIDEEALNKLDLQEEKPEKAILSYDDIHGSVLTIPSINKPIKLLGTFEQHPIELVLSNCFKQNSSTMGMNDCYAKEYQSWDSELNRAYNALGGSNNEGLKIAQRDWIRFRDSQLNYLKAEFGNRQGTKWILEYDVLRNRLIKEQVERLQIIYHTDN